jgi:hypothetical protein
MFTQTIIYPFESLFIFIHSCCLVTIPFRYPRNGFFILKQLWRILGSVIITPEKHIERLLYLILYDIEPYGVSAFSDVHQRIDLEIPQRTLRTQPEYMIKNKLLTFEGERRWRKYSILLTHDA